MREYERIIQVAAWVNGVSPGDVVGRCRRRPVSNARSVAVVLLRRAGWPIPAISAACGGIAVSSVLYHQRRGEGMPLLAQKTAAAAILLESIHG